MKSLCNELIPIEIYDTNNIKLYEINKRLPFAVLEGMKIRLHGSSDILIVTDLIFEIGGQNQNEVLKIYVEQTSSTASIEEHDNDTTEKSDFFWGEDFWDENQERKFSERDALGYLSRLTGDIKSLERRLAKNDEIGLWEVQHLQRELKRLSDDWSDELIHKLSEKLAETRKFADPIITKVALLAYDHSINETLRSPLYNISSVKKVTRELTEAEDFFKSQSCLTEDLRQKIRKGKEEAAWFRAKKKILDAELLAANGVTLKSQRALREAAIVLAQDWNWIFPGEQPPDITYKPAR
jgi:hypothetical protein